MISGAVGVLPGRSAAVSHEQPVNAVKNVEGYQAGITHVGVEESKLLLAVDEVSTGIHVDAGHSPGLCPRSSQDSRQRALAPCAGGLSC